MNNQVVDTCLTAGQCGFGRAKFQVHTTLGILRLSLLFGGNLLFKLFCLACLAKPCKLGPSKARCQFNAQADRLQLTYFCSTFSCLSITLST